MTMPFHVVLACLAVAAAVPLMLWSIPGLRAPNAPLPRDLTRPRPGHVDLRDVHLSRSLTERVVDPAVGGLARQARRLTPAGLVSHLERRAVLAGVARRWPVERLLAAKLVLGVVGLLAGLARMGAGVSGGRLTYLVVLAGLGYFGPDAILMGRARERQTAIQRHLPDVLDQITVSVEAGLGFDAALAQAGRTGKGPLAEELARAVQDVGIGVPRQAALAGILDRTDVADLRHFVLAVKQAEHYGVPIAQVLRVQSKELREKRRQSAEEHAMKIPVKIVFPLIFCILPALFVVILGPAGMRIADTLFKG
jgi:tight adherence protein C